MNAFDVQTKRLTAWCEDCDEVFDTSWNVNLHRANTGHRIKITEFWSIGKR